MVVKELGTNSEPRTVAPDEFDVDDLMEKDFNDSQLNTYDVGPGSELGHQFTRPNRADRSKCGVILRFVPSILGESGIKNMCNKYGQVKEVGKKWMNLARTGDNVVVQFASVADAENTIYNINKLCFKVNGRVMKANFYRPNEQNKRKLNDKATEESHEVKEALNGNTFKTVEIPAEFNFPLTTPSPLLEPNEIDTQRTKILLENGPKFPTIINGSAIHRHSSDSIKEMEKFALKSKGYFDEQTQHFVHNVTDDFTAPKQCQNCESFTVKFCKGCKNSFCSMYCLKEFNRNKGGCDCVSSKTAVQNRSNRYSVGRGAKLISLRAKLQRSSSFSSNDSDTKSIGSGSAENRSSFRKPSVLQECDLPENNKLVVITNVVSYEIVYLRSFEPKDNERYLTFLNDVAEYAKTAQPLDEMPKKDDIVLAEYEGRYYRARVERIENDKPIVDLLELGCVVATSVDNLKKLREDLQNASFVFKASLSGMKQQKMKTDKCLIYLYELVEKSVPLKFISKMDGPSSGVVQCELIVSETNESVNGKLKNLNNIKSGQLVMIQDIPIKPFDANATEAVVIDNSLVAIGIVTVVTPEYTSDMFSMHQWIQEYCKEEYETPYTPRVNEICLAKCNDQWYRAKLEKSFGDMNPVMLFIDFALFSKVHVDNMRRMPSEFKFPLYSTMVEVGGVTDETDMNKLAEAFPSMSKVSMAKVEFANGKTDEPKIYFDIPGGLPRKENRATPSEMAEGAATTTLKPRLKMLLELRRKLAAQAESS